MQGKSAKEFTHLIKASASEEQKWIHVQESKTSPNPALRGMLDAGKGSVIQLASDIKTDLVLIDEGKARKIARMMYGLKVVGAARVLVEAKRRGLIESVKPVLEEMRAAG